MKRLLTLLVGSCLATTSHAASIMLRPLPGGVYTVRIEDKILPGDVDTIKSMLRTARRRHWTVVALELGSWGGDADTGLAIAQFVLDRGMYVLVNGVCSSACAYAALVALGNGRMLVRSTAVLGVHQVYDNATHDPDKPWTERAARRLQRMGSPVVPLDAMIDTPPSAMTWYYVDDLTGMGAVEITDGWQG